MKIYIIFLTGLLLVILSGAESLLAQEDHPTIWVDFNYFGVELGTFDQPFNTLEEGITNVDVNGVVNIKAGATNEQPQISKHLRLRHYNGPVRIGSGLPPGFPTMKGRTDCSWGSSDCNPCANNVVGSINSLRSYSDGLAFYINGYPEPTLRYHWQGIQRLPGANSDYLVLTRNEIPASGTDYSGFDIVHMDSRNNTGDRFRSNRLNPNILSFRDTPPPFEDRIVQQTLIDNNLDHAGGVQLLGNILPVPIEEAGNSDSRSEIRFYDLSNPLNPVPVGNTIHRPANNPAGSTAMVQLQDERNMLMVRAKDDAPVDFYLSQSIGGLDFQFLYQTPDYPEDFGGYQATSFVTECGTGNLYMVGTHNDAWPAPWGEDWVDLYTVQNGSDNSIVFNKVANHHVHCDNHYDLNCNLDAGGGVYVDSNHRLIIYGAEHEEDGPDDSTRIAEFRQQPHDSCPMIEQAWVEFYNDPNYKGSGWIIDYVDSHLEDYSDYEDATIPDNSFFSVRWCIPSGWRYELYEEDNFEDEQYFLIGNGAYQGIADLRDIDMARRISSSRWMPN